jgi:hypothetical protein
MDMNEIENMENEPGDDFPSFGSNTAEPPDSPNTERMPILQHDLQPELQEQEDPAATQRDGRYAQQSVPPGEVLYHPVGDTVAGSLGLPGDGVFGGPGGDQGPDPSGSLPPLDGHLPTLYNAYHTSFALPMTPTSAHMQHAKALASALLDRNFPISSGYRVDSIPLGPFSARGINFLLKADHERDSDPDTPPPKKVPRITRKTHFQYSFESSWHHIEPARIAAFEVKKALPREDGDAAPLTYRTHTALVIVLDDLSTFHRWSRANLNHRGDVLTDVLGLRREVEKGHGMLFFGPMLEMYSYDADDAMLPVKPAAERNWRIDMRVAPLEEVDSHVGEFGGGEVVYQEE